LAVAAAHPTAAAQELVSILLSDPALPPDTRIAIARRTVSGGTSRFSGASKPTSFARGPNGSATQVSSGPSESKPGALQPKTTKAEKLATLDVLFNVAQDNRVGQVARRQAASQAAQFFLPKHPTGPRRRKFPADEYGFAVDPELARELRDANFKIATIHLETKKKNQTPYVLAQRVSALQARIKEIQQSLQCPCPSKYGWCDLDRDRQEVTNLRRERMAGTVFSPEVDLEEAIRTARSESFIRGPEAAALVRRKTLEEKKNRKNGPPLTPAEHTNFRLLSLLYPRPPNPTPPEEMLEDHPFIIPRYVVGDPNRPDGFLIFGTPKRRKSCLRCSTL
jgi:hypothetical protein